MAELYISWTNALIERLLVVIIQTGAHLKANKWKECATTFYQCNDQLRDIWRKSDPDACIRRLKKRFTAERERVSRILGWGSYNLGNLSALDTGDLGPIEIKMKTILMEIESKKECKEAEKVRSVRLEAVEKATLSKTNSTSSKCKAMEPVLQPCCFHQRKLSVTRIEKLS
jgi:hypothetical protein